MTDDNIALSRGLTVIELLAVHGSLSLARLNELSGIPKSTLRRLLLTLSNRNFIRRSDATDKYRLLVTLPMLSPEPQSPGSAALVSAVFPHALALTKQISWASDIHMMERHWMRIVDSTRMASASPIFLGKTDRRVHLFGSAAGMACLATLNMGEIYELFSSPDLDRLWSPSRVGLDWPSYEKIIQETRDRGYGTRQGIYLGETTLDDKLASIAVPVRKGGRAIGALTLLYPRNLMPEATFAEAYLPALQDAARSAEADLEKL